MMEDSTSAQSAPSIQLFQGVVSHYRSEPKKHGFAYKLAMFLINLDRVEEAFPRSWWPLAGYNKSAVCAFHTKNHMWQHRKPGQTLADTVRAVIESVAGRRPAGQILLLTNLSYFGYCFNPVSFYYIYDDSNRHVEAVIAEVTNTPWEEQHYYILHGSNADVKQFEWSAEGWIPYTGTPLMKRFACHLATETPAATCGENFKQSRQFEQLGAVDSADGSRVAQAFGAQPHSSHAEITDSLPRRMKFRFDKTFHVSPFMSMDHTYEWIFSEPSDVLLALSFWRLMYLLFVAFPLLTFRIQLWIHYEAFRLWYKGVELYPHPHGSSSGFTRLVEAVVTPLIWVSSLFKGEEKGKRG